MELHEDMLFKWLDSEGRSAVGEKVTWNMPTDTDAGLWMPSKRDTEWRSDKYHLCRQGDLVYHLAPRLYAAEARGFDRGNYEDMFLADEARLLFEVTTWNAATARLFAADCVQRVLKYYEVERPGDTRLEEAVQAARDFALGRIKGPELDLLHQAASQAEKEAESHARDLWPVCSAAAVVADLDMDYWDVARFAAEWVRSIESKQFASSILSYSEYDSLDIRHRYYLTGNSQSTRLWGYLKGRLFGPKN